MCVKEHHMCVTARNHGDGDCYHDGDDCYHDGDDCYHDGGDCYHDDGDDYDCQPAGYCLMVLMDRCSHPRTLNLT